MSDIVERLKNRDQFVLEGPRYLMQLNEEAAAEIASLRDIAHKQQELILHYVTVNAGLVEALQPYERDGYCPMCGGGTCMSPMDGCHLKALRAALRAATEKGEPTEPPLKREILV